MAIVYTEWFADAKDDSSFDRADLETLESYLDGTLSVGDAAQQLTEGEDRRELGKLWVMFLVLSKRDPEVHESIANLISTIFAIPPPEEEENPDAWSDDVVRAFSINWRDVHDGEISPLSLDGVIS
ncbi:hypothetical protein FQN49_007104 [Arthroderma sp. PD_2]|nr:hypothetical protein FQN49_007104 [Arthroderma sp. PD_2]